MPEIIALAFGILEFNLGPHLFKIWANESILGCDTQIILVELKILIFSFVGNYS